MLCSAAHDILENQLTATCPAFIYTLKWPQKSKAGLFKEDQRPDRCKAASHVGAAVLAHVARSGRSDAAHRWYFGNP